MIYCRSFSFSITYFELFLNSRALVAPLENHNRFKVSMANIYSPFQTRSAQKTITAVASSSTG